MMIEAKYGKQAGGIVQPAEIAKTALNLKRINLMSVSSTRTVTPSRAILGNG